MARIILGLVGLLSLATAFYIWFATQHFYQSVPGVQNTGPLNMHFARDVALAYLASGTALVWAGVRMDISAAIFGSTWLIFHALFHIGIWIHRGLLFDFIALSDMAGIHAPALAALYGVLKLSNKEARL